MKSQCKKPIQIRRGNVTVKIYTGTNRVGGKEYEQFTVSYYLGGRRIKQRFADFDDAKREAELAAIKLVNGESEVLKLTSSDRAIYIEAVDLLRPLNLRLNIAVGEYVDARSRLPAGVSLRDTAEFYLRRHPTCLQSRTVAQVADEMVKSKTTAGRGDLHLKDMTNRLKRFSDAFQMNISQVTGAGIQKYLDSLGGSGRTRRNSLRHITGLFRFAVRMKYLPKDALEEIEAVERPDMKTGEIEIFSPAELREIFSHARPEMIPFLAIGAFAGLRSAELQRLDWSEVDLSPTDRHVEITAGKAKTASRRLAPVVDSLVEWLAPYAKPSGQVVPFANVAKQIVWLVDDINKARRQAAEEAVNAPVSAPKFVWKRNGLRHSFVSYRIAAVKDAAQVALECGNSPAMVFGHYRQLVTVAEAEKWFAIRPETKANVLTLEGAVA